MAVTTIQDLVDNLIQRRVAEARTAGTMSPDVEASAIMDTIALNLLLNPRSVYYVAFLARNSLINSINTELSLITSVISDLQDINNTTFAITDTSQLQNAHNALLDLASLDKISTSNPTYTKFNTSINTFLTQIAPNIRTVGSSSLKRPAAEAQQDLITDFAQLKLAHTDFIERYYALVVGIQNFLNSPIASVIGSTTISRARSSLLDSMDQIAQDPSGGNSRQIALNLITARATLKSLNTFPNINGDVLNTSLGIPTGTILKGTSVPSLSPTVTVVGPATMPTSASASVTVGSVLTSSFPQSSSDLNNKAHVVGTATTYPVTIPSSSFFNVQTTISGTVTQTKIPLTSGSRTLAQVLADINAVGGTNFTAAEFVGSGLTNRIIIFGSSSVTSISISSINITGTLTSPTGVQSSTGLSLVGLTDGQTGSSGTTPISTIVDAWNVLFGSTTKAVKVGTTSYSITSKVTDIHSSMVITASWSGLSGTYYPTSNSFTLNGTVNGTTVTGYSPIGLMDLGDTVNFPTGSGTIQTLTSSSITLNGSLQRTFDGNIQIISALTLAYSILNTGLQSSITSWLLTNYVSDLSVIDSAISNVFGNISQLNLNIAINLLNNLATQLNSILTSVSSASLPTGSATDEISMVNGIIATLTERKYDRALDMFLRCELSEMLQTDYQTVSYGGALMKSISTIAQTDVAFPNKALDEQESAKAN